MQHDYLFITIQASEDCEMYLKIQFAKEQQSNNVVSTKKSSKGVSVEQLLTL